MDIHKIIQIYHKFCGGGCIFLGISIPQHKIDLSRHSASVMTFLAEKSPYCKGYSSFDRFCAQMTWCLLTVHIPLHTEINAKRMKNRQG